jgi:UDP-N-acetylmuramoylalanine--D-glutamate ligase
MDFAGKKAVVIGAGISGNAAALLVKKLGASVILSDASEKAAEKYDLAKISAQGVEVVIAPQDERLLENTDYLILSPAVPMKIALVQAALQRNIKVMSEIELAYKVAKAPIFAITGTNGKTTTTTLVGELMKKKYASVGVGGNIGMALCDEAYNISADGCIVAEISSYQLEATAEFVPHIAAILNVTPDHITRHGSMEEYQRTKEKLFKAQAKTDYLVLNYDDEKVRSMAERASSTVFFFSRREILKEGAFINENKIVIKWQGKEAVLCDIDEMQIKGGHNVENALAAAAMAYLGGVEKDKITAGLKEFSGVEHRIEPVREIGGVMYYNDSKATNTDSAIKALDTFPNGRVILIAGGTDKMTDLTEFMQLAKMRTDALILVGAAAERFAAAARKAGIENIFMAGSSMEKAVELAHGMAKPPQVVLLSPACASFDMFDGYEERGRAFKAIVNKL